MADRFYTPEPLGPGELVLTGPEAHHLAAVRRFGPGDRVVLFNGDGRDYPAEVLSAGKKAVALAVAAGVAADRELGFPLVVGAALPKADRADYLIEKLTELGATRFVPLVTERSVVRPKEAVVEKLTRAVIEASKQCGRNVLLTVDPPQDWAAFVARIDRPRLRLVLHPNGAVPARDIPAGDLLDGVAVGIGPEGGFAPDEIAAAVTAGWRPVSLGRRTLRVETAAAAVAAWVAATAGL